MAYKRNDGTDEINAIQNRFTAYLHHAVRNGRASITCIRKTIQRG